MDDEHWQFAQALRSVLAQKRADVSAPNKLVRAVLRAARHGGMSIKEFENLAAWYNKRSRHDAGYKGALWARYMREGCRMSTLNLRRFLVEAEDAGWIRANRVRPFIPHPSEVGWGTQWRTDLGDAWMDEWRKFERLTFLSLVRLRLDGLEAAALALQRCRAASVDWPSYDEMLDAWTLSEVRRKARPPSQRKFGQQVRSNRRKYDGSWWVPMLPAKPPSAGTNLAQ